MMAAKCFMAAGVRPKGDVILDFVVDEELSGHGTLDTILRGYTADAGICCETSGNAVQPGCIGRIWFEILVRGKAAGIQRRYQGVNAIDWAKDRSGRGHLEKNPETYPIPLSKISTRFPAGRSMEGAPERLPRTPASLRSLSTVPAGSRRGHELARVAQAAQETRG